MQQEIKKQQKKKNYGYAYHFPSLNSMILVPKKIFPEQLLSKQSENECRTRPYFVCKLVQNFLWSQFHNPSRSKSIQLTATLFTTTAVRCNKQLIYFPTQKYIIMKTQTSTYLKITEASVSFYSQAHELRPNAVGPKGINGWKKKRG